MFMYFSTTSRTCWLCGLTDLTLACSDSPVVLSTGFFAPQTLWSLWSNGNDTRLWCERCGFESHRTRRFQAFKASSGKAILHPFNSARLCEGVKNFTLKFVVRRQMHTVGQCIGRQKSFAILLNPMQIVRLQRNWSILVQEFNKNSQRMKSRDWYFSWSVYYMKAKQNVYISRVSISTISHLLFTQSIHGTFGTSCLSSVNPMAGSKFQVPT